MSCATEYRPRDGGWWMVGMCEALAKSQASTVTRSQDFHEARPAPWLMVG